MNKKSKLLSLVVLAASALQILSPLAAYAGDRKENEDDQTTVNPRILDNILDTTPLDENTNINLENVIEFNDHNVRPRFQLLNLNTVPLIIIVDMNI